MKPIRAAFFLEHISKYFWIDDLILASPLSNLFYILPDQYETTSSNFDVLQIMHFPREMVDLRNVGCNLKQIENIITNQESSTDEKLKKWKLKKLQNSRCTQRNAEKL